MGTLITHVTATVTDALITQAHGLGVLPDYVVVEALTDTAQATVSINVVTFDSTSFTLEGSIAGGTNVKATIVKAHSIVA